jgi:hypothetical protein
MTTEFDEMLHTDPLLMAEQITGKSYKDDGDTAGIGMLLHMIKAEALKEELSLRDDLYYGVNWVDANRIVAELGFEEIFSEDFSDDSFGRHVEETYKVFWRNGALLTLESYDNRDRINSAKVYYNWKPADFDDYYHFTSSGRFEADDWDDKSTWVWAGDHDAREALRNTLANLEGNGELLPVWKGAPFLWLLNFSVTRNDGYDYKAENARVISHFPQHVKDAISVYFTDKD